MYLHRISILILLFLVTCGCDKLPARLAAAKPATETAWDLPDFDLAARLAKEHQSRKKDGPTELENPESVRIAATSLFEASRRISAEMDKAKDQTSAFILNHAPWVDSAFQAAITSEVAIAMTWRAKEEVSRMSTPPATDPESHTQSIKIDHTNEAAFIEWAKKRLNASTNQSVSLLEKNETRLKQLRDVVQTRLVAMRVQAPRWWIDPLFFTQPRTWYDETLSGLFGNSDWNSIADDTIMGPDLFRKARDRYKKDTSPESFKGLVASLAKMLEDLKSEIAAIPEEQTDKLAHLAKVEAARAMREEGENLIRDWVRQRRLGMSEAESEQREKLLKQITDRWRELQAKVHEIELRDNRLKRLVEHYEVLYKLKFEAEMIMNSSKTLQPDTKATQE